MSDWLDSLRAALAAGGFSRWFFRDDDAGWDDASLMALVNVFRTGDGHVDLATIPAAISRSLGSELVQLADEGCLSVHQHGWTHTNHEPRGRKCEFGPSRPRRAQHGDLVLGWAVLSEQLDGRVQPFFTPPWNRCTDTTAALLTQLGFVALSVDRSAPARDLPDLLEVPVAVDWTRAWREGGRIRLADDLARAVTLASAGAGAMATGQRSAAAIGVMLHHAVMGAEERAAVGELLALLRERPEPTLCSMAVLVHEETFTSSSSSRHGVQAAFTPAPLSTGEGWN